jgi:hypothetical protein
MRELSCDLLFSVKTASVHDERRQRMRSTAAHEPAEAAAGRDYQVEGCDENGRNNMKFRHRLFLGSTEDYIESVDKGFGP